MHILYLLIGALAEMIEMVLHIYTFVILIAVFLSWVRPDPYNPIVRIIRQLTEPAFYQARRLMPRGLLRTGIDFSPMIILLAIIFIRRVVVSLLLDLAH